MQNKEENLHEAYSHNLQLFVCTYNVSIWSHKYCESLLIRMFSLVNDLHHQQRKILKIWLITTAKKLEREVFEYVLKIRQSVL